LGIPASPQANAYAICIQAGAILAVLGLYRHRAAQMVLGTAGKLGLGPGNEEGWHLTRNIIVAFLPAVVFGLLLDDLIEKMLFGLWPIVLAWFVGGVAILVIAWHRKGVSHDSGAGVGQLTIRMALSIGLIQCLAMWPGTSRSLVTIVGGVLIGLNLAAAVEFSFLLGVVTLLAATAYKTKEAGPLMLASYGWWPLLIGSVAAWISAVVAVKWMVGYLKRHDMQLFGYYRLVLALIVA
jgi:undecaprenyl-diphosphatase